MSIQIAFLSIVALVQVLTLALLLRSRFSEKKTVRTLFDVQGKLTSIQWNLEAGLSDCGKMNLCQKEFLHQIGVDCSEASTCLHKALKDMGYEPTSKTLR
ncbi:MAG: hypothetical protein KC680_03820 [Candidatus Peregrinibacteria bacterium]|nr:hypothetical protein [Candidatus Peregrinibacteria bacterium]MCB9807792.1 hypothetical protein [Candidatus Peribacteria bacterium]